MYVHVHVCMYVTKSVFKYMVGVAGTGHAGEDALAWGPSQIEHGVRLRRSVVNGESAACVLGVGGGA